MEISQQPACVHSRRSGHLFHHLAQFRASETVEKKMRDDQVVGSRFHGCIPHIRMDEMDLRRVYPLPRQLDHTLARFDAIDCRGGMRPNEFGKETSVPLAHDQDPARRMNFPDECSPRLLELIPESQRLEPAIMRRDAVEIHRREKKSAMSGVRSTRSARAVRLSRGR